MGTGLSLGIGIPFRRMGGGAANTARTQAFLTATGITDATIISALNAMDNSLISAGLLPAGTGAGKIKALYPIVGGSATTHKYNFVDPRDLDAAFRLVFFGGWTHSATGAKPNGTNAYANTFINISTDLTQNNVHISDYLRDNILSGNGVDIGNSSGDSSFYFSAYYVSTLSMISNINNTGLKSISSTDTRGFFISQRSNSSNRLLYKNGSLVDTFSASSITPINQTVRIAANNLSTEYSSRQIAFVSAGEGMNGTEVNNFNTLVQSFQTTLGRNV
jgi:hypothetical protein